MQVDYIVAALIVPVPIVHLWLHALLGWWHERPILFYGWALLVWIGSFFYLDFLRWDSRLLFYPSDSLRFFGWALMLLGCGAILSSILALGVKRFFLWAVLKPDSVDCLRVRSGPFAFLPHPAYMGQVCIMLGNALSSAQAYAWSAFCFVLIAFPLVIVFEERELKERLNALSPKQD